MRKRVGFQLRLSLLCCIVFFISQACAVIPGGERGGNGGSWDHTGGGGITYDFNPPSGQPIDYLCYVMDMYHTNFGVYIDGSSAGNNFNTLGFMGAVAGDSNSVTLNNYHSDAHSGLNSLQVAISPLSGSYAGYYFMNGVLTGTDRTPRLNWGNYTNAGIDMTGATKLTFWAKGQSGGEQVEFFSLGVGRDPATGQILTNAGTGQPYAHPDSNRKITLGTVSLTSSWQQYTIQLTNANLSYVLGAFGFVVQKTNVSVTFYLDDIAFDGPSRLNEPRLLTSYWAQNSGKSVDIVTRNTAYVYDNAVAVMAFLSSGSQYQSRAKLVLDALTMAVTNDRYYGSGNYEGRIRNAYQAGSYILPPGWNPNGKVGTIRMPGWWDTNHLLWFEDSYAVSTDTGNVAWLMLAYLSYIQTYPGASESSTYKDMVIKLGNFVENNLKDTRYSDKGFDGQFASTSNNWEPGTLQTYRSTEHNLDLYAAFTRLSVVDTANSNKWASDADWAKTFVLAAWVTNRGIFCQGTDINDNFVTVADAEYRVFPTDAQAWALLALRLTDPNYFRGLSFAEGNSDPNYKSIYSVGANATGFDFNMSPPVNDNSGHQHPDGIWFEGTGQMATAYMFTGQEVKATNALNAIQTGYGTSGVYACWPSQDDFITTGFIISTGPWYYYKRLAVAATSWAILAQNRVNAFWLGTTNGIIPVMTTPLITAAISAPVSNSVVYNGVYPVTGTAAGSFTISNVFLKLDSGSFGKVSGTSAWSTNLTLQAGSHTITVYSQDVYGNTSPVVTSCVVSVTDIPTLAFSGDCAGNVSGVTPADYKLWVFVQSYYGVYIRPLESTPDTSINSDGSWSCNAWGSDPLILAYLVPAGSSPFSNATNLSVVSARYVRSDSQAPTLAVNTPPSYVSSSNLTFTGTAVDDSEVGGVYVSLNNSSFGLIPNSSSQVTLTPGGYTAASQLNWQSNLLLTQTTNSIKVFARDDSLHVTSTNSYTVIIGEPANTNFGIYSESHTNGGKLTFDVDAKQYTWYGVSASEGSSYAYEGTTGYHSAIWANDWWGWGIAPYSPATKDMSSYNGGYLKFAVKSSSAGISIKVGIKSGSSTERWVSISSYGFSADGQWHTISVPMSAFSGINFSDITYYFMAASDTSSVNGNSFDLDDVYWQK